MIHCTIEYKNISHLNQLYTGFKLLADANVISLKFSNSIVHQELKDKPVIRIIINNDIVVYYDTLDGLNWINGDEYQNLEFFYKTFKCNYYFKRSFIKRLEVNNLDFKVFPLGLYYNITPYFDIHKMSLKASVRKKLKNLSLFRKLMKVNSNFYIQDFENYPDIEHDNVKILFSARLWDPDEVKNEESKQQRKEINHFRITVVKRLKEEFGSRFIGGISTDEYSLAILESQFLLPFEFTIRENYLKLMKQSSICIATTGLHNSIGGKLTEYVCASRAIITEPLNYEVTGDFEKGKNYLEFETVDNLIYNIKFLLEDKNRLSKMMRHNFEYYNLYLKPDVMVFNSLNEILSNI